MKKKVRIFISYAHANRDLAVNFSKKVQEYFKPSKTYDYVFWSDLELLVGEKWEERIMTELDNSDCGVLLISPAFLNSIYIGEREIPAIIGNEKVAIPVLLHAVDFDRHDLKGLQEYQLFRFIDDNFTKYRSYGELKAKRRNDFIGELFKEVEERLNKKIK